MTKCVECGHIDADRDLQLCCDCFMSKPESERWRRNLTVAKKYGLQSRVEECLRKITEAESRECQQTFDCNAGDHADCCPAGKPWYTPEDAFTLMEQASAKGHHLREFWAEHLNAAFNKGQQFGYSEAADLYEAMKEGFSERLGDVERERDYLKAENDYLKSKPGVR